MPQLDIYTFLPQFFFFVIFFSISFLLVFTRILPSLTATNTTRQIKDGSDLPILKNTFQLSNANVALVTLVAIFAMALLLYAPMDIVLEFYKVYYFITHTLLEWIFWVLSPVWGIFINLSGVITLRCLVWLGHRELQQLIILDDPQILFLAFAFVFVLLANMVIKLYPTYIQSHDTKIQEVQGTSLNQSQAYLAETIMSLCLVRSQDLLKLKNLVKRNVCFFL